MARIGLDPGHGGEDSGAVGVTGTYEKNNNLAIAFKCKSKLEARGHEVFMTRTSDVWYGGNGTSSNPVNNDLNYRAALLNNAALDCFVSIHNNSGGGKYTLVCWQGDRSGSKKLAEAIAKYQLAATGASEPSDGVVQVKNLAVTRKTTMDGCLTEILFIDNAAQERWLASDEGREKAANAIVAGILEYLGEEARSTVKFNVQKDGGEVLTLEGFAENGVAYAPIRKVVEAMGGMVVPNEDYSVINVKADAYVVEIEGKKIPGLVSLNRGYVALRELASVLGYKTALDTVKKVITLK